MLQPLPYIFVAWQKIINKDMVPPSALLVIRQALDADYDTRQSAHNTERNEPLMLRPKALVFFLEQEFATKKITRQL